MHDTHECSPIEHTELIDMRTHLTVAMLAAAQLNRRTKDLPEAAHLQEYLDQSLKALIDDVVRVDALVAQTDSTVPATTQESARHFPRVVTWAFGIVKHGIAGLGAWAYRRRCTRMTMLSLHR